MRKFLPILIIALLLIVALPAQVVFAAAAHNVNFATSGLPDGVSITVTYSGTNNGGNPQIGSATFISPAPSSDIGTLASTQFTYSGFPANVVVGTQTYNLSSTSPVSPFTTGTAGGRTTVTATYVLASPAPPTDTTPPVVTGVISPVPNGAGWNNSDVTITWSASDPESGVASGPTPATQTVTTEGAGQAFSATAVNGAGLTGTGSVTVNLDKTPPMVSITGPSIVLQGVSAAATVTASDALSGLATDPSGSLALDTSTLGAQTVTVTATDVAGNSATATLTYTVWGVNGPFAPLVKNGLGVGQFKAGSTIPVKFQLTDGTNLIMTATGKVTIGSANAAFRWDATAQQYIANVKTDKAVTGTDVPVVLAIDQAGSQTIATVDLR